MKIKNSLIVIFTLLLLTGCSSLTKPTIVVTNLETPILINDKGTFITIEQYKQLLNGAKDIKQRLTGTVNDYYLSEYVVKIDSNNNVSLLKLD